MNNSNIQQSYIINRPYEQSFIQNPPQHQLNAPMNSDGNYKNSMHFSASNLRTSNPQPVLPQNSVYLNTQNSQTLPPKQKNEPYDPKIMGTNWETGQTQYSEVRITRSCWLGYHRNNFHPSMTQYRISYDEFNAMIDKIEDVASSFAWIQTIYILMVILTMFSLILLVIGLFIEPGESVTDESTFEALDDASTGLIITGILLFFIGGAVLILLIVNLLRKYEFRIRKMLQEQNQHHFYSRNIHWFCSNYCSHIEIKCLPVSAQQYYMMMLQTNQLKMSKEYMEKIKQESENKK